jgi:histidinol phosphatase-like PHP family hydrolase
MIDFHSHSIFSDGELIPSELVRRAEAKGYRALAITDHVDISNVDFVIPRIQAVCKELRPVLGIYPIAGAEITHVPPRLIASLSKRCRDLGAELIIVHGETPVEPVAPGTNTAALNAGIDILAHPGLLTMEQAETAAARNVYLELSCRAGHSLGNGLVAKLAVSAGARLLVNTDAHAPSDLRTRAEADRVAYCAGLGEDDVVKTQKNAEELLGRLRKS